MWVSHVCDGGCLGHTDSPMVESHRVMVDTGVMVMSRVTHTGDIHHHTVWVSGESV